MERYPEEELDTFAVFRLISGSKLMGKRFIDKRLFEIHGPGMWNRFYVERAIELAGKCEATGLIFHCNELVDRVVFPSNVFSKEEVISFNPMRNSRVNNDSAYLRSILDLCGARGLEFYAEVKEFSFDDELIFKYPEIIGTDGKLCATHPILFDYLEKKYDEFLNSFPAVAGTIVSVGTVESKVSISSNHCHCKRCQETLKDDWFKEIIQRLYNVDKRHGKTLVIRDFAYNKANQDSMINAVNSVSNEIIMAVKKAPHDYYPVSVDNPAIGKTSNQWVEFDTWGQFFSLGAFPASIVEDIHARLKRFYDKGIKGIMIRTCWENMSEASVYNSFNAVNAIGAAMISADLDISDSAIYQKWGEWGLASPLISDSHDQSGNKIRNNGDLEYFTHIVKEGYDIIRKTMYAGKNLFAINSRCFDRVEHAHYYPLVRHPREAWEPGVTAIMIPTEEHITWLMNEKQEALDQVIQLVEYIRSRKPDVSPEIMEYLDFLGKAFFLYVRGFQIELRSYLYLKSIEEGSEFNEKKVIDGLKEFDELADEYDSLLAGKLYNHEMLYMFDGSRLRSYKQTVIDKLNSIHEGDGK